MIPRRVYIDDKEFVIYQQQFSGGNRRKAISTNITIAGQQSRQMGWLPRKWEITLWLTPEKKEELLRIWETDGALGQAEHFLRVGDYSSYAYVVTFDELEMKPHDAVEERWLADISLTEYQLGLY